VSIVAVRRISGYLSWLLPLLLAGCATAIITPATEEQIGGRMDLELQQQVGLYQDASLSAYVDAVGKRLVAAMEPGPYTFRFHIIAT
jgi:predicted Zn-dependent protease